MLQAAHQQEEPELDITPDQLQALIQGAFAKLRALGSRGAFLHWLRDLAPPALMQEPKFKGSFMVQECSELNLVQVMPLPAPPRAVPKTARRALRCG